MKKRNNNWRKGKEKKANGKEGERKDINLIYRVGESQGTG
jgi:hypothetical protein